MDGDAVVVEGDDKMVLLFRIRPTVIAFCGLYVIIRNLTLMGEIANLSMVYDRIVDSSIFRSFVVSEDTRHGVTQETFLCGRKKGCYKSTYIENSFVRKLDTWNSMDERRDFFQLISNQVHLLKVVTR